MLNTRLIGLSEDVSVVLWGLEEERGAAALERGRKHSQAITN
jgi:hypothetical protein